MKKKIIRLFLIIFIVTGCTSQEQLSYENIKNSEDIESLELFLRKYPNHKNKEDILYRIRIFEYRKIKDSNDPILFRYFVQKYKTGRDVSEFKKYLFDKEMVKYKKEGSIRRFIKMKNIFFEPEFQDKIDFEIYVLREKEVKNSNNVLLLEKFVKDYPLSPISETVKENINNLKLAELFEKKEIKPIEDFLNNNPSMRTKEVKEKLSRISLEYYKGAKIEEIESYIAKNQDDLLIDEFKDLLINKKYKHYIAFFERDLLIALDEKHKIPSYAQKVAFFKDNKDKIENAKKAYKALVKPIEVSLEERNSFFTIPKNSIEEAQLTLKMPFFINDLEPFLKKGESSFQIMKIASLIALESFYNRNQKNVETLFSQKIDFFNTIPQDTKILKRKFWIYFVTDNELEAKKVLKQLVEVEKRDLFIQILGHIFVENQFLNIIDLMLEMAKIHDKTINDTKSAYKNKTDHYTELYYIDLWLNFLIKERKGKMLSSGITEKVKQIRAYTEKIKKVKNPFEDWNKYEKEALTQLEILSSYKLIDDLLKEELLNYFPFKTVKDKLRLKKKTQWDSTKERLYSLYLSGRIE